MHRGDSHWLIGIITKVLQNRMHSILTSIHVFHILSLYEEGAKGGFKAEGVRASGCQVKDNI